MRDSTLPFIGLYSRSIYYYKVRERAELPIHPISRLIICIPIFAERYLRLYNVFLIVHCSRIHPSPPALLSLRCTVRPVRLAQSSSAFTRIFGLI